MEKLIVTSPSFEDGGLIPVRYTGYGEDISPKLLLKGISPSAVSLVIIMDDMDHPIPSYHHWVIWNLPVSTVIPESIAHGEKVESLSNAVQGRGYGKHRYKGPKPPFRWSHKYHYNVYVLDCLLDLPMKSRKKDLLKAMQGRVLQEAVLIGHYR